MPSISGQSILIIGGSSGIGFAIAKLALAEKVRVSIASSKETRVQDAVDRLKTAFPQGDIKGYTADLAGSDPEASLEKLLTNAAAAAGPLDHIIFTAGRPNLKPLADFSADYFHQEAKITMLAAILLAKLGPKHLRGAYTSSIIYTTGEVARRPSPDYALYSGFASGVHGLARAFALDLKPVRVNVVCPGSTDTEMWGQYRDAMREMIAKSALLGKPGSADEVAEAYIYLMKDTNATGSIVSTNGGKSLQ